MVVMLTLAVTINSVALCVTWRLNQSVPGIREWFIGFAMLAMGIFLLTTQKRLHPLGSVVTADLLLMGGYMVILVGALRFKDRERIYWGRLLTLLVVASGMVTYLSLIQPDASLRIALVSFVIAGLLLSLAFQFFQGMGHVKVSSRLTAAVCTLHGVIHISQGLVVMVEPAVDSVFVQSLANQILFLGGLNTSIFLAFGLIIMTTERLQADLRYQAAIDPLTSVFNRRAFFAAAEPLLQRAQCGQRPTSVLIMDLDHFKSINDTHGHSGGDKVLQCFAATARQALRGQDLLTRFGGEEFVALLPETPIGQAVEIAERVRRAVERSSAKGVASSCTVSIGAAVATGDTLDQLIARADIALYQAKHQGRNRVVAFDAGVRGSVGGSSEPGAAHSDAGLGRAAPAGGRQAEGRPIIQPEPG